jgi:thiol:disulfide interchange protein DsbD
VIVKLIEAVFGMALALAVFLFLYRTYRRYALVETASKGGISNWNVWFLFGFSLAFYAMFPGWLNSLPKSGGWLNTVKVV